jgi:hypothetical protein
MIAATRFLPSFAAVSAFVWVVVAVARFLCAA